MNRLTGFVLILTSATAFGTLGILGRYGYAAGMDAPTILFLRFTIAAIVLACLLAARRERLPRGKVLLGPVAMGAVGYAGQAYCYFTALQFASPGLVALLLYLYPAFVAILAALILHERITRRKALALGLVLLGTALTANPEGGEITGIVLAITAAAIYSVYIVVGTSVMRQISALQSSTVIFAAAGVTSGLVMLVDRPHFPTTPAGWLVIVLIVLVGTVLPVVAFLSGLKMVGPTNAAMLSTIEPVVTVLLAAWLLGERLPAPALAGGALILAAVIIITKPSNQKRTNDLRKAG